MIKTAWLVFFTALSGLAAGQSSPSSKPTGYHVEADNHGVWWFVAPDGERFLSLGINNVSPAPFNPRPNTKYYDPVATQFGGDQKAWGAWVRKLLREHGLNTLGAWSNAAAPAGDGIHRTIVLYAFGFAQDRCLSGLRPGFEDFVRTNIRTQLAQYPDPAALLGAFLDNEMPWAGRGPYEPNGSFSLLEAALELPADDAAHTAAVEFLKQRYSDAKKFAAAWDVELDNWKSLDVATLQMGVTPAARADRNAFAGLAANRLFTTGARIARQELPGTLLLGVRYAIDAPDTVLAEDAKVCDVISLNDYFGDISASLARYGRFWAITHKPLMITEFAWRAAENNSSNPNTRGAGAVVKTQAERAAAYERFVTGLADVPTIIGAHWFEFADQSPQGRFDGEDSNYGIVDIHNKPYEALLAAMERANGAAPVIHAKTTRALPTTMPPIARVTYTPDAAGNSPAKLDLLHNWLQPPEIWGASDAKLTWHADGDQIVLDYHAGAQYGAGINFNGLKSRQHKSAPNASDFRGCTTLVIDYDAPRGLQLNIVLSESGAAAPGLPQYDKSAGDDGEAFISASFFGRGHRVTKRIELGELQRQLFYGNQSGNNNIDLQALRSTGVQVQGKPAEGMVRIYGLRLE